jgi:hypothetical protein
VGVLQAATIIADFLHDPMLLRVFCYNCVERVILYEKRADLDSDARSVAALRVLRRYTKGQATDDELKAAWDGAYDAAALAITSIHKNNQPNIHLARAARKTVEWAVWCNPAQAAVKTAEWEARAIMAATNETTGKKEYAWQNNRLADLLEREE